MQRSNLVKVIYQDPQRGISLECYADTIVYQTAKGGDQTLFAIRLGGYLETRAGGARFQLVVCLPLPRGEGAP